MNNLGGLDDSLLLCKTHFDRNRKQKQSRSGISAIYAQKEDSATLTVLQTRLAEQRQELEVVRKKAAEQSDAERASELALKAEAHFVAGQHQDALDTYTLMESLNTSLVPYFKRFSSLPYQS